MHNSHSEHVKMSKDLFNIGQLVQPIHESKNKIGVCLTQRFEQRFLVQRKGDRNVFTGLYTFKGTNIGCSFMYSGFGSYSIFYFYSFSSLPYSFENCSRWICKLKYIRLMISSMFIVQHITPMVFKNTYSVLCTQSNIHKVNLYKTRLHAVR